MSAIGAYLRALRETRGWPPQIVAQRTGFSYQLVEQHEQGCATPSLAQQRIYARAFEMADVLEFMDGWRSTKISLVVGERTGRVPIINRVPAGRPVDYEEYSTSSGVGFDYAERPLGFEDQILFAFIVAGDSMSPTYAEGDLVYCTPLDPRERFANGAPAFVRFTAERGNACTFKCLHLLGLEFDDDLDLRPLNPAYSPLRVSRRHIAALALAVHRAPRPRCAPTRYLPDEFAQDDPD